MRLSFSSKRIRELCEKSSHTVGQFGKEKSALIHDALAELRAAPSLGEIPKWSDRMNGTNGARRLTFVIAESVNVEFSVNQLREPVDTNGEFDWEKVSSIKILKLEILE